MFLRFAKRKRRNCPKSFRSIVLLDDVDGLRSDDLRHLLVDVKLNFVEIKVKPGGKLTDHEDYPWRATQDAGYAHLQLGDSASENCYFPEGRNKRNFFTEWSPIKPGSCLQVTYLVESTAVNELVEVQDTGKTGFSRWTLRDRASGVARASVSDAFRLMRYSVAQPGWDRRGNQNRCQSGTSGYGLVLDRIRGTVKAVAHNNQFILGTEKLPITGLPATYPDLRKQRAEQSFVSINTQSGEFVGERSDFRDRMTWNEAYQEAVKRGAWVHSSQLILPNAGTVFGVSAPGFGGKWGTTGSQLIYVTTNDPNVEDGRVLLFGVNFQGKHLWSAQTAPLGLQAQHPGARFESERFELTKDSMLIHGIYSRGLGEENRPPWTIRIALSDLKTMEKAAQQGTQK
jgi:hypothetical protein